jgi:hypothetical protein
MMDGGVSHLSNNNNNNFFLKKKRDRDRDQVETGRGGIAIVKIVYIRHGRGLHLLCTAWLVSISKLYLLYRLSFLLNQWGLISQMGNTRRWGRIVWAFDLICLLAAIGFSLLCMLCSLSTQPPWRTLNETK